jgi:hypothetical protein
VESASIPYHVQGYFAKLLQRFDRSRSDLKKTLAIKRTAPTFKQRHDIFIQTSQKFFDIAGCKCDLLKCCSRENKIHPRELTYRLGVGTSSSNIRFAGGLRVMLTPGVQFGDSWSYVFRDADCLKRPETSPSTPPIFTCLTVRWPVIKACSRG